MKNLVKEQQRRIESENKRKAHLHTVNRDKKRYLIRAMSENGVWVYYVDNLIGWTLCKYAASQFYGEPYCKWFIKNVLAKETLRFFGEKKLKDAEAIRCDPKYVDPQFYYENVMGNEAIFDRMQKKQSEVNRKARLRYSRSRLDK